MKPRFDHRLNSIWQTNLRGFEIRRKDRFGGASMSGESFQDRPKDASRTLCELWQLFSNNLWHGLERCDFLRVGYPERPNTETQFKVRDSNAKDLNAKWGIWEKRLDL
jgi:hypothetical protein